MSVGTCPGCGEHEHLIPQEGNRRYKVCSRCKEEEARIDAEDKEMENRIAREIDEGKGGG